jgi:hypothetical protein
MAFQISPGVNVTEKDLTNVIPAVATTTAGIAGYFKWGPAEEIQTVISENRLKEVFGKPDANNYEQWFSAANFLGYGNNLQVVRMLNSDTYNSYAPGATANAAVNAVLQLKNKTNYFSQLDGGTHPGNLSTGLSGDGLIYFAGRYAGDLGNSLKVSVSDQHTRTISGLDGSGITSFQRGSSSVAGIDIGMRGNFHNSASTGGSSSVTTYYAIAGSSAAGAQNYPGSTGQAVDVFFGGPITQGRTLEGPGASGATGTQYNNAHLLNEKLSIGDKVVFNTSSTEYVVAGISGGDGLGFGGGNHAEFITFTPTLAAADYGATSMTVTWAYASNFDFNPDTSTDAALYGATADEIHIAVIDSNGKHSGTPGTVLEKFVGSKAKDAKNVNGRTNYYVNLINDNSEYIYWGDHMDANSSVDGTTTGTSCMAWGSLFSDVQAGSTGLEGSAGATFNQMISNFTASLTGGSDGTGFANASLYTNGYDKFADAETVDCSLVIGGNAEATLAGKLVDMVEARKDSMVFLSPLYSDVVEQTNSSTATTNATGYYNDELSKSSSYGVMDSGWKYQYDPYNDVYRWIPLNADVAGLCARTEFNQDAWFSPAGFNRGRIRNVVKLAFQPQKADRDNLYKNNLNPVVTFPGEGTILFGDKTMQRKPSAFDRINVRRLFIILEKAISTAAKYQLFEFNDEFTRANFINMVEPFLRDVQGRRGITDFRVICDETNNTSGVIDRNEFVADIYVKPNRSINYIQLNFVAVGSGVAFNEIAG